MPQVRKQRFVVDLDDDAMRRIRILRAVTGLTNQAILSESIRLVSQKYHKEIQEAMK